MALERYTKNKEWDIPILDGPSKFVFVRQITTALDRVLHHGSLRFTVLEPEKKTSMSVSMMDEVFGLHEAVTWHEGRPVLYIKGLLYYGPLPVLNAGVFSGKNTKVLVQGLFSVEKHDGGFNIISVEHHSGHRGIFL